MDYPVRQLPGDGERRKRMSPQDPERDLCRVKTHVAQEPYILLAMPGAEEYRKDLQSRFPQIPMYAVATQEEIGHQIDRVEILITIYRVADDLLKQAVNLKWMQVITSGVNYI